jgi:Domain of unknown function (DUF4372)
MALAQLTHRESLRDDEASISAQPAKLWHLGFRGPMLDDPAVGACFADEPGRAGGDERRQSLAWHRALLQARRAEGIEPAFPRAAAGQRAGRLRQIALRMTGMPDWRGLRLLVECLQQCQWYRIY